MLRSDLTDDQLTAGLIVGRNDHIIHLLVDALTTTLADISNDVISAVILKSCVTKNQSDRF